MASQRAWWGGFGGPDGFRFDDSDVYQPDATDPESPQDLTPVHAFRTTHQVLVETPATQANHVSRLADTLAEVRKADAAYIEVMG